jgi:hypothetical protein
MLASTATGPLFTAAGVEHVMADEDRYSTLLDCDV